MPSPDATRKPVFRFAPSPNGPLHLGHAASAVWNERCAAHAGGRLLVRIEDIDEARCTPAFAAAALADLDWLGISYERPVLFQSTRREAYAMALARLKDMGLVYPCSCTRRDQAQWSTPPDPEGMPRYPGTCRTALLKGEGPFAWRIRMDEALARTGPLTWTEGGQSIAADASAWGDVVIARKDIGTSYHLAVVVDDAAQGVTHVVRGRDLYQATAIHRVLQALLGLPAPKYLHHPLVLDDGGHKLSKSDGAPALAALRQQGISATELRQRLEEDAMRFPATAEW